MAEWPALCDELNAWSSSGRKATLWWRDDDACSATGNLERLLNVAKSHRIPLCLAAIPNAVQPDLRSLLEAGGDIAIAVHGITHENFAVSGAKKCELTENRPIEATAKQLVYGLERLIEVAGEMTIPVLVPPWNRIAPAFIPLLPGHGYAGLSTYGHRRTDRPTEGLLQVNCHVDPIDWRNERKFMGAGRALDALIDHLKCRRLGKVDADEPTGLLTHHAIWTDEAFKFIIQLLSETRQHPAVQWLRAQDVFGLRV
ncbi:MAG: hypothetical protein CL569_13795 [Alphaproteobacteria bacterium]|nr:hypothetical protein [Alphaproteobacteria bacterium]|tara:strand:- start:502 stop:1269 length:768 start_codon:yes stop_codon:yes gene_type:complete